ncbi:MAG: hypothetical protein ABGZ17_15985, partial [Planctomycetaceae bacterium]
HTARQHAEGLQSATMTSQAALHRIRLMFGKTAVYQVATQPTRLGAAVVHQSWNRHIVPSFVVLWTGGLDVDLAARGTLSRLPVVHELLIYGPDPHNPAHLVEMRLPDVTSTIDFDDATFNQQMLSLIHSRSVQKILICDHLQVAELAAGKFSTGNVRFEFRESPNSDDLGTTNPDDADWGALKWAQGVVGLRQANLDIELLIETQLTPDQSVVAEAIPFFDSASRCYVHQF